MSTTQPKTTSSGTADRDDEHAPATDPIAPPLTTRIEALLIASDRPLTESRLAELLDLGSGQTRPVRQAIEELNAGYRSAGRAFGIERLAGGWQLLTRAEFGDLLARLHADRLQSRLSPAALETLAIIAYRHPVIRAEIEAIRGVSWGEVLRGLLDRRLVKIVGRAEVIGRPMLYGPPREFLKVFGLGSLDDLPRIEGLERRTGPAGGRPPSEPRPGPEPSAESGGGEADPAP
jgi:segregation and condensation protein B